MSRLLGIIAADTSSFDRSLLSTPQSLPALSDARPDGWGAAVYDARVLDWRLETRPFRARGEETVTSVAPGLEGTVLVAHMLERTEENSVAIQPFRSGRWVFAHEGRVEKRDNLVRGASADRLGRRTGDSDGELLFAYVLSQLDDGGATEHSATSDLDAIVERAIANLIEHRVGAVNFLLSDGNVTYAHRYGRSLWLLERREPMPTVTFASEPLTDDAWCPLDERTLLRCERTTRVDLTFLCGCDPREPRKSDIELPFTD